MVYVTVPGPTVGQRPLVCSWRVCSGLDSGPLAPLTKSGQEALPEAVSPNEPWEERGQGNQKGACESEPEFRDSAFSFTSSQG